MNMLRDTVTRRYSDDKAAKAVLTQAVHKLGGWVKDSPSYSAGTAFGCKGQNKSFSSNRQAVDWLFYKQQKPFLENQQKEKQLAEKINDSDSVRRQVFIIKEQLCSYINKQLKVQRTKDHLKTVKGRYAHFYSKIFFNRNLYEAHTYFSKKSQANLSRSEFAAYLADLALGVRPLNFFKEVHIHSAKLLRYNLAALDNEWLQIEKEIYSELTRSIRLKNAIVTTAFKDAINGDELSRDSDQLIKSLENLRVGLDLLKRNRPTEKQAVARGKFARFLKFKNQFATKPNVEGDAANEWGDSEFEGLLISFIEDVKQRKAQNLEIDVPKRMRNAIKVYLNEMKGRQQGSRLEALRAEVAASLQQLSVEEKRGLATKGDVRRINYNVAIEDPWAQMMMQKNMVIGAGPSSTTMVVLGLVSKVLNSESGGVAVELRSRLFCAACIMFAFWQRKKKTLSGSAAVHSWNEVCVAFDIFTQGRASEGGRWLRALPYDPVGQFRDLKIYPYPTGFSVLGAPEYPPPEQENI